MKKKGVKKASKKVVKKILVGTIRVRSKGLGVFEKTAGSWKRSNKKFPELMNVVELFKAHKNLDFLIDKKHPEFLKGQFYDGMCQGARINILPDGEKIEGAYSLFGKNLTIHDESSNTHWDVIYQNPNGKYAYLYTIKKRGSAVKAKYKKVENFEKCFPNLEKSVLNSLKDKNDKIAVAMFTLLKTYMRVGNELYYKKDGHKGLTTLKKGDIKISSNTVSFKYKGKDGVPRNIVVEFPSLYVKRLREILASLKNSDFVFTGKNGHPFVDSEFKASFKRYCGIAFYPHIVRSYYATTQAENFLKSHRKATKDEISEMFLGISRKLGHKRFAKKDHEWKDSYTTTIHHYIEPSLVEKIQGLVGK